MSKNKSQNNGLQFYTEMSDEDYFDDCPICQALKNAKNLNRELTATELKEAFQQARDTGAIVGGDWFEEKNN